MERVLQLMPYKGKQKRTFTLRKEEAKEPVIAAFDQTEIWMWQFPVSEEYIMDLQKSFLGRGLFFLWLTWCFVGRKCVWARRQIWSKVKEKNVQALFGPTKELAMRYLQFFMQNEYPYLGDEKWLILCSDAVKGWEMVRFIYACQPNVAEIILYHSDIFNEELAQFQAENGIVISKTWDLEVLPECTLILDCGVNLGSLIRSLNGEVTYLDLEDDRAKRRRITRESAKIQYISLGNFLDRHFQNGL